MDSLNDDDMASHTETQRDNCQLSVDEVVISCSLQKDYGRNMDADRQRDTQRHGSPPHVKRQHCCEIGDQKKEGCHTNPQRIADNPPDGANAGDTALC